MSLIIQTTKEKLAAAFEQWAKEYENEPETFTWDVGDPKDYGNHCADRLIKLLFDEKRKVKREG